MTNLPRTPNLPREPQPLGPRGTGESLAMAASATARPTAASPVPWSVGTTPTPSMTKPQLGRCLVVFSTRGTIGTTVVATNLAVSLAQRQKKSVCLVDLDVIAFGGVAKLLNIPVRRSLVDIVPALKRPAPREAAVLEPVIVPHSSGVHTITCLLNQRQLSQLDPTALVPLFDLLKMQYAYIVVDGGKAFAEPLMEALDAAQTILLVTAPEVFFQYQTKWALGMLERLSFPPSMVKVIINRVADSLKQSAQEVQGNIPYEVISVIPTDTLTVQQAATRGVPLVAGFGHTEIANVFGELAQTLATRTDLTRGPERHPPRQQASITPASSTSPTTLSSARLYVAGATVQTEDPSDDIAMMKQRIHARLVQELDLRKLDPATMTDRAKQLELRQKTERTVTTLLAEQLQDSVFSQGIRAQLVKEISDEALGLGPLEELLADPEVTDILVNSKDQIYVERQGRLELTSKRFISDGQLLVVIERIVAPLGRRIDELTPMVDARLPDGSRVNAVIPPLSLNGPVLSIRKFTHVRYTAEDLIRFGSLTPAMVQFLETCVQVRKNLIVSGGAGTGKTTLLDLLSTFIPDGERIVTLEDAAELKLAQTHWVRLEARPSGIEGKGEVTIRDLFRNVLRMRPDRIIIGECRGAETFDMLQAMNTGHSGSITTVHANSPQDVVRRLDSMILMSEIELPLRAIREMVASTINMILHTARFADGSRKITAITELTGLINGTDIVFQDLFTFRQTGTSPSGAVLGEFVATGKLPTFLEELKVKGLPLDESIFTPGSVSLPMGHPRGSQ